MTARDVSERMILQSVKDEDGLRAVLDTLNESGVDYKVAGMDSVGNAFLATLTGPYAEGIAVMWGNPWDSEVDYSTGIRCEECYAANNDTPDHIKYPAEVILREALSHGD